MSERYFSHENQINSVLPYRVWCHWFPWNDAGRCRDSGSLGATSTGSITITVSVPSRVQITGLNDVAFTNVDPSVNATNAQSNCVWSNTATKGYTVTATGDGTAGAFTLKSGALTPIAYSVQWNQSTGQSTGTALASGTASTTFNSTATTPTCATAPATSSASSSASPRRSC